MFNNSVPKRNSDTESGQEPFQLVADSDSHAKIVMGNSSLLSGLSREMRTQMNAIVAYSFLMNKKEYSDNDRNELTDQIHHAGEQIINLLDNFIDSALIDNGSVHADSGILDPGPFFNDLFSEFKTITGKSRYRDILFISEIQEFDHVIYTTDTNKLSRVIRNLFHHALSNTKSGYIKAGIKLKNKRIIFSILDSGYGYLKSKEFLQAKDFTELLLKTGDIYTAVSMSLVQKLVKILDGMIWIERNGLAGSGIYLSIPAITASVTPGKSDNLSNTIITI